MFIELKVGKPKNKVKTFNTNHIITITPATSKIKACFIELSEGPKYTNWTIQESYEDVINKLKKEN